MANQRLWEGKSLPRRPMEHSIAVLCGDLEATFGTGLLCAAVQQGKTMCNELWLWPYARHVRAQYPLLMAPTPTL